MEVLELLTNVGKICGGAVVAIDKVLKVKGLIIESLSEKKKEEVKNEITFIVDFNSFSAKAAVKKYLEAKGIDSTILVCTNPAGAAPLDLHDEDQWKDAVKALYQLVKEVQETSPKKIHIFINAPVALAFAIGYVSRPLQPYIYQFDNANSNTAASKKYAQIMRVTDELRVW